MSYKRKLHHFQTKTRPIRVIYLVIALAISLSIAVFSLRQNNLKAIQLRNAVLKADEENGDVETALKNLRQYTYAHMNTDLSSGASSTQQPVQLKYTYDRLVTAEKDRVSKNNEKIYADAQAICEKQFPVGLSGSGRIPCIENYVSNNGAKEQPIQDALYKFGFTSPKWSADAAGFFLLLSCVLAIVIVAKLWLDHWLKKELHEHL